jgi:hypothetical protein
VRWNVFVVVFLFMLGVAAGAPSRFIQAEGLGLHGGATFAAPPVSNWLRMTVAKATFINGRMRAGVTALDFIGPWGFGSGAALAPIHVGYNVLLRPEKTVVGCRFVRACYVEAAAGYASYGGKALYARVTAAAETDWFGLGIGAEGGGFCLLGGDPNEAFANEPRAYLEVKLRLLTAAFRI